MERNGMETTQERRKGLTLYLNLFSNYLLILALWKDMAPSNAKRNASWKEMEWKQHKNVVKV